MIASWQESDHKPRQCVEKQRRYFADKGLYIQGYGLPNGHVQFWKLDHKEGRMPKNWCHQTVVQERTLEGLLDSREVKPVNLKGYQSWMFTGRTDAGVEAPVFWSSVVNRQLIGKVPDYGKHWRQKDKRVSQDVLAGQHHQRNEHELGQTPGDGKGQGGLACCSPWGHKESDTTDWLNKSNRKNL